MHLESLKSALRSHRVELAAAVLLAVFLSGFGPWWSPLAAAAIYLLLL